MNHVEINGEWAGQYPVLVIAHRGASGSAPENTLAAFRKALEIGADMIELDVHLSRDGEVMVIHDDAVNRRTNGTGRVADLSRAELQQLDAGGWFGEEFRAEPIPALEEVLNIVKGRMRVNVEIKTGYLGTFTMDDLVDRTLGLVESQDMLESVLFSSFYPPALQRIRVKREEANLALLLDHPWQDSPALGEGHFRVINCARDSVTGNSIIAARESGLLVNIWTVNQEAEMEWFIRAKVNGIFTDYPERLIRLLEKQAR
ncbi:MAG: glycerophosphodiester phosphodiesterase family protein [Smithellaceae bacterium]|nr:glycerophosphodiester phosphodiesterase family protein [Smithellaceae bacterium]